MMRLGYPVRLGYSWISSRKRPAQQVMAPFLTWRSPLRVRAMLWAPNSAWANAENASARCRGPREQGRCGWRIGAAPENETVAAGHAEARGSPPAARSPGGRRPPPRRSPRSGNCGSRGPQRGRAAPLGSIQVSCAIARTRLNLANAWPESCTNRANARPTLVDVVPNLADIGSSSVRTARV